MRKLFLMGPLLLLLVLQGCINTNNDSEPGAYEGKQPIIYIEPTDRQFATDATHKGLAYIELGKLAIKQGADKKIKNFGSLLIKQHTKMGKGLQKAATNKKLALPAAIDSATSKNIEMLSAYSGKAFDKAYVNFMINNHEEGIKFFEHASKHVVDKDLKKIAQKNLLILHRHLYALNGIKSIHKY